MSFVDRVTDLLSPVRVALARLANAVRPYRRRLISNLVVGLAIALLLQVFDASNAGDRLRGTELDATMRLFAGTETPEIQATNGKSYGVTLLDIDEETLAKWDEPLFVPRDRLLSLLDYAVQGGAALIVVDVVLNHAGFNQAGSTTDAKKLASYIGSYSRRCADRRGRPGPSVILERGFVPTSRGSQFTMLRSYLDPDVIEGTCVFWASPLFDASDSDGVVRRWRQWESYQSTSGESSGFLLKVPSTQLAVATILGNDPKAAFADLRASLTRSASEALPGQDAAAQRIDGLVQDSSAGGIGARVFYTIPWRGAAFPGSISAFRVAGPRERGDDSPLSDEAVRGRLVLIGSTAQNSDLHATPIGMMPGSLIILNAVKSLEMHGVIKPLPIVGILFVEAALIVVMSVAFLVFRSFWGMFVSSSLIVAAIPWVTFHLLRSGVFIDFMIPLIAVQLHALARRFEDASEHAAPAEEAG